MDRGTRGRGRGRGGRRRGGLSRGTTANSIRLIVHNQEGQQSLQHPEEPHPTPHPAHPATHQTPLHPATPSPYIAIASTGAAATSATAASGPSTALTSSAAYSSHQDHSNPHRQNQPGPPPHTFYSSFNSQSPSPSLLRSQSQSVPATAIGPRPRPTSSAPPTGTATSIPTSARGAADTSPNTSPHHPHHPALSHPHPLPNPPNLISVVPHSLPTTQTPPPPPLGSTSHSLTTQPPALAQRPPVTFSEPQLFAPFHSHLLREPPPSTTTAVAPTAAAAVGSSSSNSHNSSEPCNTTTITATAAASTVTGNGGTSSSSTTSEHLRVEKPTTSTTLHQTPKPPKPSSLSPPPIVNPVIPSQSSLPLAPRPPAVALTGVAGPAGPTPAASRSRQEDSTAETAASAAAAPTATTTTSSEAATDMPPRRKRSLKTAFGDDTLAAPAAVAAEPIPEETNQKGGHSLRRRVRVDYAFKDDPMAEELGYHHQRRQSTTNATPVSASSSRGSRKRRAAATAAAAALADDGSFGDGNRDRDDDDDFPSDSESPLHKKGHGPGQSHRQSNDAGGDDDEEPSPVLGRKNRPRRAAAAAIKTLHDPSSESEPDSADEQGEVDKPEQVKKEKDVIQSGQTSDKVEVTGMATTAAGANGAAKKPFPRTKKATGSGPTQGTTSKTKSKRGNANTFASASGSGSGPHQSVFSVNVNGGPNPNTSTQSEEFKSGSALHGEDVQPNGNSLIFHHYQHPSQQGVFHHPTHPPYRPKLTPSFPRQIAPFPQAPGQTLAQAPPPPPPSAGPTPNPPPQYLHQPHVQYPDQKYPAPPPPHAPPPTLLPTAPTAGYPNGSQGAQLPPHPATTQPLPASLPLPPPGGPSQQAPNHYPPPYLNPHHPQEDHPPHSSHPSHPSHPPYPPQAPQHYPPPPNAHQPPLPPPPPQQAQYHHQQEVFHGAPQYGDQFPPQPPHQPAPHQPYEHQGPIDPHQPQPPPAVHHLPISPTATRGPPLAHTPRTGPTPPPPSLAALPPFQAQSSGPPLAPNPSAIVQSPPPGFHPGPVLVPTPTARRASSPRHLSVPSVLPLAATPTEALPPTKQEEGGHLAGPSEIAAPLFTSSATSASDSRSALAPAAVIMPHRKGQKSKQNQKAKETQGANDEKVVETRSLIVKLKVHPGMQPQTQAAQSVKLDNADAPAASDFHPMPVITGSSDRTHLAAAGSSSTKKQPVKSRPRDELPLDLSRLLPEEVENIANDIQANIMKKVAQRNSPGSKLKFFGSYSGTAGTSPEYEPYVADERVRHPISRDMESSLDAPQGSQTGDRKNGLLAAPALDDNPTGDDEEVTSGLDNSRAVSPDPDSPRETSEQFPAEDLVGGHKSTNLDFSKTFSFRKMRDASEFRELFESSGAIEDMSTDQLYRSTALVANAMATYQNEYLDLKKILDDEFNATKRQAQEETLARAEASGTRNVRKDHRLELRGSRKPLDQEPHITKMKVQDKLEADIFFFQYDPSERLVGNQNPLSQREGLRSARLRSRPRQSVRAAEAEDSTVGKRTRKPREVLEAAPESARRSTRARKPRTLDDEAGTPVPSSSQQTNTNSNNTPKGKRGRRPKEAPTPSQEVDDGESHLVAPDAEDLTSSFRNSLASAAPEAISTTAEQSQDEAPQPPTKVDGRKRKRTAGPAVRPGPKTEENPNGVAAASEEAQQDQKPSKRRKIALKVVTKDNSTPQPQSPAVSTPRANASGQRPGTADSSTMIPSPIDTSPTERPKRKRPHAHVDADEMMSAVDHQAQEPEQQPVTKRRRRKKAINEAVEGLKGPIAIAPHPGPGPGAGPSMSTFAVAVPQSTLALGGPAPQSDRKIIKLRRTSNESQEKPEMQFQREASGSLQLPPQSPPQQPPAQPPQAPQAPPQPQSLPSSQQPQSPFVFVDPSASVTSIRTKPRLGNGIDDITVTEDTLTDQERHYLTFLTDDVCREVFKDRSNVSLRSRLVVATELEGRDYFTLDKGKKMSISMKLRWSLGEMLEPQARRTATMARKKAAKQNEGVSAPIAPAPPSLPHQQSSLSSMASSQQQQPPQQLQGAPPPRLPPPPPQQSQQPLPPPPPQVSQQPPISQQVQRPHQQPQAFHSHGMPSFHDGNINNHQGNNGNNGNNGMPPPTPFQDMVPMENQPAAPAPIAPGSVGVPMAIAFAPAPVASGSGSDSASAAGPAQPAPAARAPVDVPKSTVNIGKNGKPKGKPGPKPGQGRKKKGAGGKKGGSAGGATGGAAATA